MTPTVAAGSATRLPRFRRAASPPAFRLTDDDVTIIRHLAHHRFLQSTHIAALVGRSLDRTNDRLKCLFHTGYIDRPRAQLDYYPNSGSAPMVYAIADRGARLLTEHDGVESANVEWSRKNKLAGRPFIEHQIAIADFRLALENAARRRLGVQIIPTDALIASLPTRPQDHANPFALRTRLSHQGTARNVTVIPDLVAGLRFSDGSRRCFMVEIDRGTMPVVRADYAQTSFVRKMHAYLSAYASREHERQFGWKTFRVLTVTTDERRMRTMTEALHRLHVSNSPGELLFLFANREELFGNDPLAHAWRDGTGRKIFLI